MGAAMLDTLPTTILRLYPRAAKIIDIQSYRPGYRPYPARVTLQTSEGLSIYCVVKASANPDMLAYEAQVLRALTDLRFPVPEVLAGPVTIKNDQEPLAVMLV